jgi:hypothetical protein
MSIWSFFKNVSIRKKERVPMLESAHIDQQCASALLEAWCRDDFAQIGELAAQSRYWVNEFFATDPGESERLELVGAIANALHRAALAAQKEGVDPYVRLLLHLANPDAIGAFAQPN